MLVGTHLLLGGSKLGDSLGALRDGVLGELSGELQADGGLDLAGREGGLAVVADQLASLTSDALKEIVDEGVHDGHGALGDASVGVNLLEHLEDVRAVGLNTASAALLASSLGGFALALSAGFALALCGGSGGSGSSGGGLSGLGGGLLGSFRRHVLVLEF
jgi:hypothetical protein